MKKGLKVYDGGSSSLMSYNPIDGGTVEFRGKSHAKGGIKMSFDGSPAEVEGGETAVHNPDGGLMIMGNMRIPGTKTKFKQASKAIAKKENSYDRLLDHASKLIDQNGNDNQWDRLKFQTGMLLMDGASQGQIQLASKKADLSALQESMLDTAAEMNLDPISMSEGKLKKGKWGMKIAPDDDPDPKKSVAQRHNNPGNIKYNPNLPWQKALGVTKGEAAKDGGFFAMFPNVDAGLKGIQENLKRGYGKYTAEQAIKRWTNNEPYNIDLGGLKGKKVSDMSGEELAQLQNIITKGEDGKTYNFPSTANTSNSPSTQPTTPKAQYQPINPSPNGVPTAFGDPSLARSNSPRGGGIPVGEDEYTFNTTNKRPAPYQTPFNMLQIAPELISLATNRNEYVPAQRFTPQLFQPFQVSFQDRLNRNQSTFNAASRIANYNPAMLGSLTARKYEADMDVAAEEFRTNQASANEVTNRNVSLLNDAQLKNLQIADQQMVRQSQARSNTKAQLQTALNSITSKYLQHKGENSALAFYQDMFDYRPQFDDKGKYSGLGYEGEGQTFGNMPAQPGSINSQFQSKTVQKNLGNGNFERTTTPSQADQTLKNYRLMKETSPNRLLKLFGIVKH